MKNLTTIFKTAAIRLFCTSLFLLTTIGSYAQTGFPDDTEDVPAAPVDDWIIPFIVVVSVLGYYFLRMRIKQANGI